MWQKMIGKSWKMKHMSNSSLKWAETILSLLFAIDAILFLGPFYMWPDFKYSIIFIFAYRIIQIMIIPLSIMYLLKKYISKKNIILSFGVGIILCYFEFYQYNFTGIGMGALIKILDIIFFVLVEDNLKRKSFILFRNILAVLLIPGIIIFCFNLININIPYSILEPWETMKAEEGGFYRNYIFAVVLDSPYYAGSSVRRMCGIFNEPGVVGTLAALMLMGTSIFDKRKVEKKVRIIYLLSGICSLSIAFFVLVTLYVGGLFFKKRTGIFILLSILSILLMAGLYISIPEGHFLNKYFFDRIIITSEGISGNNRAGDKFSEEYGYYLDTGNIIFGEGQGRSYDSDVAGSSSYKMLIWDYGFIWFIFSIGWIILAMLLTVPVKNRNFIGCLLFLLSIYQRPHVFNIAYIIILLGGVLYNNGKRYED
jgi:hypothetical protein